MDIEKDVNPTRYWVHFPEKREGFIFQMENKKEKEDTEYIQLLIGCVKDSGAPFGKLKIVWSGDVTEFLEEFGGGEAPNDNTMRNAIAKYIHECYNLK